MINYGITKFQTELEKESLHNDADMSLEDLLDYVYAKHKLEKRVLDLIEAKLRESSTYVQILKGIELLKQDHNLESKEEFSSLLKKSRSSFSEVKKMSGR